MYQKTGEAGARALRAVANATATVGLVIGCGLAGLAQAEAPAGQEARGEEALPRLERFMLSAAVESYRWEEFSSSGARLLQESGPRLRLGVALDNMQRPSDGWIYRLSASVYAGQVDYDGQTQDGTPATTNTNYLGWLLEGLGGWRCGDRAGFDVFGGLAVDGWRRDLLNGRTITGAPVQGYMEDYLIVLGKLGLGGHVRAASWRAYVHAGAQRPLKTYERVYLSDAGFDDDVGLHPGKDTSGFARLQLDLGAARARAFVALYYEGLRLKRSDAQTVSSAALCWPSGICAVTQPQSQRDIVALEAGLAF